MLKRVKKGYDRDKNDREIIGLLPMPPKNVFLSSPDPHSDALIDFRAALIKHGLKVFTNDGIPHNSDLARREIAIADCVVVALVSTTTAPERFKTEIDNALAEKKQIIVVQLEDADVPKRLQDHAIIDLRNNLEIGLQMVILAISGKGQARFSHSPTATTTSIPTTNTPQPVVPNIPPQRLDTPIRPKPMTSSSESPIAQEGANPATVIAVMFAIAVIGFVVLTNLPTGGGRSRLEAVTVTQRPVSSSQVEFSTPHVAITLPNTWEDKTSQVINNRQWQNLLGLVDTRATRNLLQMGLIDRETQNILVILRLPMNNQPITLRDLQTALTQTTPQSGMTLLETRLRSYGFGDALFVAAKTSGLYQYMVVTMQGGFMYLTVMVSETENTENFNRLMQRFQIRTGVNAPA